MDFSSVRCFWGLKGVFGASGREFSGWEEWANTALGQWDHARKWLKFRAGGNNELLEIEVSLLSRAMWEKREEKNNWVNRLWSNRERVVVWLQGLEMCGTLGNSVCGYGGGAGAEYTDYMLHLQE